MTTRMRSVRSLTFTILASPVIAIILYQPPAYAVPITWSFHSRMNGALKVIGTRKDLTGKIVDISPPVLDQPNYVASTTLGGSLPESAQGWRYTFPSPAETILTLVIGSPGSFDLPADLNALGDAVFSLIGNNEFLAPYLFNESVELFVGIDLSRYLLGPPPFAEGDIFSIVNGTHPLLPGFIVGTTEIEFDPAIGLTTANPFTGTAEAIGTADGKAVPEPSTILLFGISLLGLIGYSWRGGQAYRSCM